MVTGPLRSTRSVAADRDRASRWTLPRREAAGASGTVGNLHGNLHGNFTEGGREVGREGRIWRACRASMLRMDWRGSMSGERSGVRVNERN